MGSPYKSHLATPSIGPTVKDGARLRVGESQSVHGNWLGSGPQGTGQLFLGQSSALLHEPTSLLLDQGGRGCKEENEGAVLGLKRKSEVYRLQITSQPPLPYHCCKSLPGLPLCLHSLLTFFALCIASLFDRFFSCSALPVTVSIIFIFSTSLIRVSLNVHCHYDSLTFSTCPLVYALCAWQLWHTFIY